MLCSSTLSIRDIGCREVLICASSESAEWKPYLKGRFGAVIVLKQAFGQCRDVSDLQMQASKDADPELGKATCAYQ